MNELFDQIDIEMRIAAAKSVRDHMTAAINDDTASAEVRPCVIDALTDALIDLRTQQIEKMWPPRSAA